MARSTAKRSGVRPAASSSRGRGWGRNTPQGLVSISPNSRSVKPVSFYVTSPVSQCSSYVKKAQSMQSHSTKACTYLLSFEVVKQQHCQDYTDRIAWLWGLTPGVFLEATCLSWAVRYGEGSSESEPGRCKGSWSRWPLGCDPCLKACFSDISDQFLWDGAGTESKEEPEVKRRQESPVPLPSPESTAEPRWVFHGGQGERTFLPFSPYRWSPCGDFGDRREAPMGSTKDEKVGLNCFRDPKYEDPFMVYLFKS